MQCCVRGLQHHILVLLWCLVGWRDDQSWMYSPFFSFGYGRCRTVARSLHEHKQSKTTFVQGPRRSRSAGKSQQIKQQKPNKQQDDPQIPQPDLRFVKAKNSKPDTQRGKSPNKKHPQTGFAKGHSGLTTVSHSKTCQKNNIHHEGKLLFLRACFPHYVTASIQTELGTSMYLASRRIVHWIGNP